MYYLLTHFSKRARELQVLCAFRIFIIKEGSRRLFGSNIAPLLVKLEELNLTLSSCEETTAPLNQEIIYFFRAFRLRGWPGSQQPLLRILHWLSNGLRYWRHFLAKNPKLEELDLAKESWRYDKMPEISASNYRSIAVLTVRRSTMW